MAYDPISILGSAIRHTFQHFDRMTNSTHDEWQEINDRNDAIQIMMAAQRCITAERELLKYRVKHIQR